MRIGDQSHENPQKLENRMGKGTGKFIKNIFKKIKRVLNMSSNTAAFTPEIIEKIARYRDEKEGLGRAEVTL